MNEYIIKTTAPLPKEEGLNGFADDELAQELWHEKIDGRGGLPRVVIGIYSTKEAKVDKDGNCVATIEWRRVQPVKSDEGRRAIEEVLYAEYVAEHGDMLPFEVKNITKRAFADLPRDTDEIDQAEERERDTMSPADELRKHLERVHGREDAHLLTDGEAEHRHGADHDGDLPGELAHDRGWIGWTRADIEAATAETDGGPHADEGDTEQLPLNDRGEWDPATDANEMAATGQPLFSEGRS